MPAGPGDDAAGAGGDGVAAQLDTKHTSGATTTDTAPRNLPLDPSTASSWGVDDKTAL